MPKLFSDEHPELFHYTNATGLAGIMQSQTLRATHYAYLNDATEIKYFLEFRLPGILQVGVDTHLKELAEHNQTAQPLIAKQEADRLGKEISASLLDHLLGNARGKEPLAEPYIASFCTARDRDELVSQHGLLSQWRGYGRDGGYAIVFDTAELSRLLDEAGKQWENGADLFAGDVVYSSDCDKRFVDEFAEDLRTINRFVLDQLQGLDNPKDLENSYVALMRCACRYKHWGFKEENEVRVIVIPYNNEVLELAKADGLIARETPRKQYIRSGSIVPFIELFEGITSSHARPLPIRRIIVGPTTSPQERARRVRAVEVLIAQHGIDAEVSVSDIPYAG